MEIVRLELALVENAELILYTGTAYPNLTRSTSASYIYMYQHDIKAVSTKLKIIHTGYSDFAENGAFKNVDISSTRAIPHLGLFFPSLPPSSLFLSRARARFVAKLSAFWTRSSIREIPDWKRGVYAQYQHFVHPAYRSVVLISLWRNGGLCPPGIFCAENIKMGGGVEKNTHICIHTWACCARVEKVARV